MTHPSTHPLHDLQNLLHRAGWALSLAPQVVSAAEFAERDGWITERGLAVHEGVNAYEDMAEALVREINAALGIDLAMAPSSSEDFEAIQRLGRAVRRNPSPGRRRPRANRTSKTRKTRKTKKRSR